MLSSTVTNSDSDSASLNKGKGDKVKYVYVVRGLVWSFQDHQFRLLFLLIFGFSLSPLRSYFPGSSLLSLPT